MTLLITGGAGYIGGQTALVAMDAGREVVVIDDLRTGGAAPPGAIFVKADAGDTETVARVIRRHRVTEVIHFAASVVTPRSIREPLLYYDNNVGTLVGLLRACVTADVTRLVFSSTAAVYGDGVSPAMEDSPARPVTPYGRSKLMGETILRDVTAATDLSAVVLRYFNVAGADPAGRAGQGGDAATHLVKVACEVATGARAAITVHGDDWPTADGAGVRDFIHVHDVARAHLLALERLSATTDAGRYAVFNLGSGRGHSVLDVIAAVGAAAGRALPMTIGPRRPGDVAEMVADTGRARNGLGWTPCFSLGDIADHAMAWERASGLKDRPSQTPFDGEMAALRA
jgi:UDP-glucose 4-epimerase